MTGQKEVYVLRYLKADKANPVYRVWESRCFLSKRNAEKEFKDMPGYRGSSMPRYTHMTADMEVYVLKKIVRGKRVKRFSDVQHWYIDASKLGKECPIVITPAGRKAGLGRRT